MPKLYVSPSQIGLYTKCGEAYRRRYICKEVIPPKSYQINGIGVHKAAEFNFKQKIESYADLNKKEVVDFAVTAAEGQIKNEGLLLTKEESKIGKKKVIGEIIDTTANMTGVMMVGIAPIFQPVAVEEEVLIPLNSSSHDLKGILDMRTDKNEILDIKTSKQKWTQKRADRSGQLTFYSMIYRARTGKDPKAIRVANIVKNNEITINPLTTKRSMPDYKLMIGRINRVLDGINKGVYTPASEDSWLCDERYCGFWDTCKVRSRK